VVPLRLRPGDDLRLAGAAQSTTIHGDLEILSLASTLAPDGTHLHLAIADASGAVLGLLPDWQFSRELDASTGYAELQIRPHNG
jgi:CBS-domain-containing membrane protein